jgi:hypothetical protein
LIQVKRPAGSVLASQRSSRDVSLRLADRSRAIASLLTLVA